MKNDGGAAFATSSRRVWTNEGGQYEDIEGQEGMSLRDWFAGMILQGNLANTQVAFATPESAAESAYSQADAMIAERRKDK